MTTKRAQTASIGDDAVRKATGRNWTQWFTILDKAGGREMSHKEIVAVLTGKHSVGSWWRQMVAVGYEQARGLRAKHERPDGFSISKSKTIAVPISTAYQAWSNEKIRRRWLKEAGFTMRKSTANRSMRLLWVDGKTTVEVMFYRKGPAKSLVTVQHNRLTDAKHGARMKSYWSKALDKLTVVVAE